MLECSMRSIQPANGSELTRNPISQRELSTAPNIGVWNSATEREFNIESE